MDKLLLNIKPKYYPLIAFGLGGLAMYMMLSYSQVLSTGIFTLLEGDLIEQYVPFIKCMVRNLINGENLWFSWSNSLGSNTALTYAYYAMSPFNVLYLILFYVDEAIVTALVIVLKTALAASFFQIFASKVLKCQKVESIVFSVFYAMCAFQVVYSITNIIWIDAVYMLPIICYLIMQLIEKKKWVGLSVAYTVLFVSQFYLGYMVGIFSFMFFIGWILLTNKAVNEKKYIIVTRYLLSVTCAILISSAVWLPTMLFLFGKSTDGLENVNTLTTTIVDIYNNMFWGQIQNRVNIQFPYLYCGIPVLILVPLYFLNKAISVKERVVAATMGVFWIICMLWTPLYVFIHAFDAPSGYGFRFSFIVSFFFLMLACRQASFIKQISIKRIGVLLLINVVIYSLSQRIQVSTSNEFRFMFINVVFIVLWSVAVFFYQKSEKQRVALALGVLLLTMIETVGNGYVCMNKTDVTSPTMKQREYSAWRNATQDVIEEIQSKDKTVYRINYAGDMIHNSDSWFGYMGVSDFSTAEIVPVREAMSSLGFFTSPRLTFSHGITPVTAMLLGVKYEIDGANTDVSADTEVKATYKMNDQALSLGYLAKKDILKFSFGGKNSFQNMNDLVSCMTGKTISCYEQVPEDAVAVSLENMDMYSTQDAITIRKKMNSIDEARMVYTIPYDEREVYVQFEQNDNVYSKTTPILEGGSENKYVREGQLSSSYVKKMISYGEEYEVAVYMDERTDSEAGFIKADFYYCCEDEITKAFHILSTNQLDISVFKNGYLKGNINVSDDDMVLFTSIPFDLGWSVTENGRPLSVESTLDGAFLAVPLSKGQHELEFKFTAPGSKEGMILSICGVFILAITGTVSAVLRRTKKERIKK